MPGLYALDFSVRDYECDMQGIVNNAVYQNYLEHTRHAYLLEQGLDFAALTLAGVHMVVLRAELDYLQSLRSGDRFKVTLCAERTSNFKVVFLQEVIRAPDETPVLRARIFTGIRPPRGTRELPQELEALLATLPRGGR